MVPKSGDDAEEAYDDRLLRDGGGRKRGLLRKGDRPDRNLGADSVE